jgi:hypothetical protein
MPHSPQSFRSGLNKEIYGASTVRTETFAWDGLDTIVKTPSKHGPDVGCQDIVECCIQNFTFQCELHFDDRIQLFLTVISTLLVEYHQSYRHGYCRPIDESKRSEGSVPGRLNLLSAIWYRSDSLERWQSFLCFHTPMLPLLLSPPTNVSSKCPALVPM